MTEQNIKTQRIGKMFDYLFSEERSVSIKTRIGWKIRQLKEWYRDSRNTVRNHRKWHGTLKELWSFNGTDGLILAAQTHLRNYIAYAENYSITEETYKKQILKTAEETIALLERMREPDEYLHRRRDEVEARYPKYQSLITEYLNGGISTSGDFVPQGKGWAGRESGNNPREGYFEFRDGRLELAESPDQRETDRLLDEHQRYYAEIKHAYTQAEQDSDQDFERLHELIKGNLYAWWG
jgi:hypothetical protein